MKGISTSCSDRPGRSLGAVGDERSLAVFFADIRGFTRFGQAHLAYDVVHILNRYYESVGRAILDHGGYLDKIMGDGLMALFGLDAPPGDDGRQACCAGVRAGLQMHRDLVKFNCYLRTSFGSAFQIGVGIHYGPVIIGRVGIGDDRPLTAIGDVVNIAARLEKLTRRPRAKILVGDDVWYRRDPAFSLDAEVRPVRIRGRSGHLGVVALDPDVG